MQHRILVVDNDPTMLQILSAILENKHYEVRTATCAMQAQAEISAESPALVLLDTEMPQSSGIELLRSITSSPHTADIPVIVVTEADCDDDLQAALSMGARDYILKPFSPTVVHARVEAALQTSLLQIELKRSYERYRRAATAGRCGLWEWSLDTDYLYITTPLQELLGMKDRLPQTMDEWLLRVHPDDRAKFSSTLQDHIRGHSRKFEIDHRMAPPVAPDRWFQCRGSLSRALDGRPLQMLGAVTDITQQKAQESDLKESHREIARAHQELEEQAEVLRNQNEALCQSRANAEEAARAKDIFLANMSHEMRTPLTAILGFAEVLLGEDGLERAPPQRVESIRTIRRNGEHLLELINDLLDLSKIEAGKLEIERVACSVGQLLDEVRQIMQLRAQRKGLNFAVESQGPLPEEIFTDPTRLRQILLNLTANAIKFTHAGRVQVLARPLGKSGQPRIQFEVTDTGIGIAPQQLDLLFQPFQQGDASTTRQYGGTGLGLAITRRLTEMLGGEISVDSTVQMGSVFRVEIPAESIHGAKVVEHPTPDDEAVIHPHSPQTPSSSPTLPEHCRVLLVDDGDDNRRLLSLLLNKAGGQVEIAEDGHIALEKIEAAQNQGADFDVVLMDMLMPVLDGYQTTRILRERSYGGSIIALTANALCDDRQKCLKAGCDDYLAKPIRRDEFIALVAKHVRLARATMAQPSKP